MQTRKIGKSDIITSALSMGAWAIGGGTWWGDNDDAISIKTIHKSLDSGVNWIDTAPVYGFGHSEDVIGKALKGRRDKAIISTKCGNQWYTQNGSYRFSRDGHDVYLDLSPQGIRRDLEYSLRRLDTDYIDIYFTHRQSTNPELMPVEETMYELMKMKKEGKIRAIGASNVSIHHLTEYVKYGQLDVIQEKYSMLDPAIGIDLLPFCANHGITFQAFSPIERGLLAGKIPSGYKPKPGDARENKKWWLPQNIDIANEMLLKWEDLTLKYNCSLANLIINWTIMQSDHINVLFGARKLEHIEDNVNSTGFILEPADVERMSLDAKEAIAKSI